MPLAENEHEGFFVTVDRVDFEQCVFRLRNHHTLFERWEGYGDRFGFFVNQQIIDQLYLAGVGQRLPTYRFSTPMLAKDIPADLRENIWVRLRYEVMPMPVSSDMYTLFANTGWLRVTYFVCADSLPELIMMKLKC